MARRSPKPLERVLVAVAEDGALSAVRWMLAGPDRRVILEGRLTDETSEVLPAGLDRTVLIAPGDPVIARRLRLTAARPAQARIAALAHIAEDAADAPETLRLALADPDTDGGRMAAAVTPAVLDGWLARARELGLSPDVIVPDSLLPPAPEGDGWSILNLFDRTAARGRDRAFTAEPDLAAAVIGAASTHVLENDAVIEAAAVNAAFAPPLNLLDDPGEAAPSGRRPWRRALILAAVAALSPLLLIAADAVRYEIMSGALDRRSREALHVAWPNIDADADPAAEVRRRLGPALTGGFSGQAARLFAAAETVDGVTLESLILDDAGDMRAAVAHPDYAAFQALNTAASDQGLALNPDTTLEEAGRMVSDVTVVPQ